MRKSLRKISLLLIGLLVVSSAFSASMAFTSNVNTPNVEQQSFKCHEQMPINNVAVHKAPLSGCHSHCSMNMSHAVLSLNKMPLGNEVLVVVVNSKNTNSLLLDQHASPLYRPPIIVL